MKPFNNIFTKVILSLAMPLAAATSFVSCTDDDNRDTRIESDREFMTMYINDNTRGKGSDYPYNSGIDGAYPHGNTIHLYWYGIDNCAGYHLRMGLQNAVANGPAAWEKAVGTTNMALDTIVGPETLDLLIKDLPYSVDYRISIRTLSKRDQNILGDESTFAHASKWWGQGGGREWQDYQGIQTAKRYETPYAVYVDQSKTTETTMHVMINSNIKDVLPTLTDINDPSALDDLDKDKYDSYMTNFNVDANGEFGFKYLTVEPSPSNPNSTVGAKWRKYEITSEDRERGYIEIDGLQKNSTYVINVIDPTIPTAVDAKYNTCTTRSGGTPGEAILLEHDDMIATYAEAGLSNMTGFENLSRSAVFGSLATRYNAAPISPVLYDFISNADYAEGQTFELEGGKTYYIDGNDITCKGFVLRTRPEDVAAGKRAKVICGIGSNSQIYSGTNGDQWQGSFTMFMFGRQPEAGEGGEIYMKKLAFYDIDFDNPTSLNYGDNQAGAGTIAGNYFFNMYSNGMAVTLDSLVIENCTFKRLVRGFIREQGINYKKWNHVLITNNQFFDCGYYNNGAGGYCWIAGSGNNNASNLYNDMKVTENTFFDSPFPSFFSEEKEVGWETGIKWNITFSNNTLINFNTRANGSIFKMRNLPDGSVYNVKNNLIVLCKKSGDQRVLAQWGADIRNTLSLSDGTSGKVTLNFDNNWSTNNDLTNGQIFSGNAWTSTSNNFGKLVKNGDATLNGTLEVQVANVSATELMEQPCPPFVATTSSSQHMHRADALDGSAGANGANLYIKNKNNEIYQNNVGAARWRK